MVQLLPTCRASYSRGVISIEIAFTLLFIAIIATFSFDIIKNVESNNKSINSFYAISHVISSSNVNPLAYQVRQTSLDVFKVFNVNYSVSVVRLEHNSKQEAIDPNCTLPFSEELNDLVGIENMVFYALYFCNDKSDRRKIILVDVKK